jgi:hypothetical protein
MADDLFSAENSGIAGLGAAFKGALEGWQDGEDRKLKRMEMESKVESQKAERERNNFLDQMTARDKGFMKGPNGQALPDVAHRRGEAIEKLSVHGIDPQFDDKGEVTGTNYNPEYLKLQEVKASADPLGLKTVQLANAKAELAKKQQEAGQAAKGFKLPPDKVLQVQQGSQIPTILGDIEKTLDVNKDSFGPIGGRIGAADPYDTKSQTIDAQFRSASQMFGRYMEGGVLRKEDEDKYRKMFPQLSDTPDVARNKLAIIRKQLVDKQNADVQALSAQGYDTSGFKFLKTEELPGLLTKKKGLVGGQKGLIAAPAAPAKPQTVIQNGVTYTLNPATGEYE